MTDFGPGLYDQLIDESLSQRLDHPLPGDTFVAYRAAVA
jgi:hypothetical protein